jgi:hypothetical protein
MRDIQNIPLSKQSFITRPQIENGDVVWSARYNLPVTTTNKRRALSPQEVELDGGFLTLHIVLETCIIYFMHKFNMSVVFSFFIFLDWRLRFEPALQNETHMRASILDIGPPIPSTWSSGRCFIAPSKVESENVDCYVEAGILHLGSN